MGYKIKATFIYAFIAKFSLFNKEKVTQAEN